MVIAKNKGSRVRRDVERTCRESLLKADVQVGGDRPWDLKINAPQVWDAALRVDICELGEAFVRGDWDCDQVDELIARVAHRKWQAPKTVMMRGVCSRIAHKLSDGGSRRGAKRVGLQHYDLSNELFEAMLDSRMIYSCGYWDDAEDLEEAQEAKLDHICKSLGLEPGMTFLDIGCGWGGLVKHAAERFGVRATGITISQEQFQYATKASSDLPVEIRLQDYRDLTGKFDRIASIGMFEHVGRKHHGQYMSVVREHLSDDGLFLMSSIGTFDSHGDDNSWIVRFIFPGGHVPGFTEFAKAFEGKFVLEGLHNYGGDYDKTLMAWFKRFDDKWPELARRFSPEFYRRWRLYLQGCAGGFRTHDMQLWEFLLSPG